MWENHIFCYKSESCRDEGDNTGSDVYVEDNADSDDEIYVYYYYYLYIIKLDYIYI